MASGLGIKPAKHRQMGFPMSLIHMVPGPQGLGSQAFGLKTEKEKKIRFQNDFFTIFIIYNCSRDPTTNFEF